MSDVDNFSDMNNLDVIDNLHVVIIGDFLSNSLAYFRIVPGV
jgi:hypothetical protein